MVGTPEKKFHGTPWGQPPRISSLKIFRRVDQASMQGHASLWPFHLGTTMLAVRFNRVDAPQSVDPKLKARLAQCGRAFLIAGYLNSGLEPDRPKSD